MTEAIHSDVLIVGAGISGIGTAYHLKKTCGKKTFRILERRPNLGRFYVV
jgi:cation diffusion facilitator CzcD-associated flavoprotein CzcO